MLLGGNGKSHISESDNGAGPATVRPPSIQAAKTEEARVSNRPLLLDFTSAGREIIDIGGFVEPIEEGEGAELEIEAEFRRKLHGSRFLPRKARAGARRAAREWRRAALSALREKRLLERATVRALHRTRRLCRREL